MGSPPGRVVGRRRSWPGAPLAAVAEDWHAEQRAEAGRRVHVGSRALAVLAAAGIVACLIVLSSDSFISGGKGGGLRRHRLDSGRRMAAEVPFAQQHTIAAGVLVEPAQQRQLLPKLAAGSGADEQEAAGSLAAAGLELAGQQLPGGSQGAEEAELDEEEEEEEQEEEEEENLDEDAGVEAAAAAEQAEAAAEARAAAAEAAAADAGAAGSGQRSGGSKKANDEAAGEKNKKEGEDEEELLTREEFELQAQRWQAEAVEAAHRGGKDSQLGKQQAASDGSTATDAAAGGAAKAAATGEQQKQREVEEDGEGPAQDGRRGVPAGGRKVGGGGKAGPAKPAEPAETAETAETADPAKEEEEQRQQRRGEAAARAGQVSLTTGAAEAAERPAAYAEPASGAVAAAATVPSAPSKGGHEQPAEVQGPAAPKSPYQLALERCNDLACLREAAKRERHPGQFLFPHALVIGWQKSAAAGLFAQLAQHPAVLAPQEQESEFFSEGCNFDPSTCPHEDQQEYIQHMLRLQRALRQGLRKPVIEGSTRYAAEGPRMAKGLHEAFPWLKLVASLREPISRAVAVLASAKDEASQRCLSKGALFACLKQQLPALNYTAQLDAWLDAFPADQVMLLQYETLASPDQERVAGQLSALHKFLGLEATATPANGSLQLKESQPGARSWRIKAEEYQALVKLVRPDARSIAELVAQHGFGAGKQWLKGWEKVWQATLNTCTLEGDCTIRLV